MRRLLALALLIASARADGPGRVIDTSPGVIFSGLAQSGIPRLVAVGAAVTAYSDDGGNTWIAGAAISPSRTLHSITYRNGRYVAVGTGVRSYSTDGITWTHVIDPTPTATAERVASTTSIFVASDTGHDPVYSSDGITWTQATGSICIPNTPCTAFGAGIAFNGAVFALGAVNGSNPFCASASTQWECDTVNADTASTYEQMLFNGTFIAISGSTLNTYTSADGLEYTKHDNVFVSAHELSACGNGTCLAISGGTGNVVRSTDGITWTNLGNVAPTGLRGMTYSIDLSKFIAVGVNITATSVDNGVTWSSAANSIGELQGVFAPITQTTTTWTRRVTITIDHTKVAENVTDFPVLLTEANMPSEIWSLAKNGGGDLRITTDTNIPDGSTANRVPLEVVTFNTSTQKAELWFKATLSSSSDTVRYLWYGNNLAVQPPAISSAGSRAVWSNNYRMVLHLGEPGANWKNSVNDTFMSVGDGAPASQTGQIGNSITTASGKSIVQTLAWTDGSAVTASLWRNAPSVSAQVGVCFGFDLVTELADNRTTSHTPQPADNVLYFDWGGAAAPGRISASYASFLDSWRLVHLTSTGSAGTEMRIVVGGVQQAILAGSRNYTLQTFFWRVGGVHIGATNYYCDGSIDEFRLAIVTRSNNWALTEFNSQSSPATFVTTGTPEQP